MGEEMEVFNEQNNTMLTPRRIWDYEGNEITINDVTVGQCIFFVRNDEPEVIQMIVATISPSTNELSGDVVDMFGFCVNTERWNTTDKCWEIVAEDADVIELIDEGAIKEGDILRFALKSAPDTHLTEYSPDATFDELGVFMYAVPFTVSEMFEEEEEAEPEMIPVSDLFSWIRKYKTSIASLSDAEPALKNLQV